MPRPDERKVQRVSRPTSSVDAAIGRVPGAWAAGLALPEVSRGTWPVRLEQRGCRDADTEDQCVDDNEADQRVSDAPAGERRRDAIGGAQQAVDHVGLASDLGHEPAGDHRHEPDRRSATQAARTTASAP